MCPRAECVSVSVCAHHFLIQIIPQFPFTCPQSLSIDLSFQTAAWCVSQVQSLNSISLPAETLYLLQLYRVRGISQRWSFLTAPKVTHSAFRYCMRQNSRKSPSSHQAHCLCGETCHHVGYMLLQSQGAGRVQEVLDRHPQGFSYSQDGLRHLAYRMGSKGQGGFSSVGSAYICKTLMSL